MKSSYALSIVLILCACSGAQPALPSRPQSAATALPGDGARHGISWMGKGLNQRTLLYVTNPSGTVSVYRYWQRTLAGVLLDFTQPMGVCADQAGNVYILDYGAQSIDEYAHGNKKPIRKIDDASYNPYGCSVDPASGNLAIANSINYGPYTPGDIAIYPHGTGTPTTYEGADNDHFVGCAYDDHGDLLVVSKIDYYYSYLYYFAFYYLPKHGTKLIPLDLQNPHSSSGWGYVSGVAWDGKYWVVEAYNALDRFSINIKAKYIDDTTISGSYGSPGPLAFYRKNLKSDATQITGGSGESSKNAVDYWAYPAGGAPLHTITKDLDGPFGVAISAGTGGDR